MRLSASDLAPDAKLDRELDAELGTVLCGVSRNR